MINIYATLATLASFAKDRLNREEKGATAVEYGLMVALIAVAIIGTVILLGEELVTLFEDVTTGLQGADPAA